MLESFWVHHRRFFLLDRLSGINTDNRMFTIQLLLFVVAPRGSLLELMNVRYAKSIKIVTTLSTDGNYIQPPMVVVEYDELTTTSLTQGAVVQVSDEHSDDRQHVSLAVLTRPLPSRCCTLLLSLLCFSHDFFPNQTIECARAYTLVSRSCNRCLSSRSRSSQPTA